MSGKLEQRIQSAHLTRTEKVIANYFLEHKAARHILTADTLALGVSDTSVIRLCRTLGYRGFRELQESLRSELSQVIEREKYVIPQHQVPDKLQKYQDLSLSRRPGSSPCRLGKSGRWIRPQERPGKIRADRAYSARE